MIWLVLAFSTTLTCTPSADAAGDLCRAVQTVGTIPTPQLFEPGTPVFLSDGFGGARFGRNKLHLGFDLRVPAGTTVYAARRGTVRLFGQGIDRIVYVDETLADGTIRTWLYGHVDEPWNLFEGDVVEAGDRLGEVFDWPWTTLDGRFEHHLHLEVWENGHAINVRRELGVPDELAPTIRNIWFVRDGANVPLSTPRVRGAIDIVVDAFDQSGTDPSTPFLLAVSEIKVEVRRAGAKQVERSFRLAIPRAFLGAHKYANRRPSRGASLRDGLWIDGVWVKTMRNHRQRMSLYEPTNEKDGVIREEHALDTRDLDNGPYDVTVYATDEFGQTTQRTVRIDVEN